MLEHAAEVRDSLLKAASAHLEQHEYIQPHEHLEHFKPHERIEQLEYLIKSFQPCLEAGQKKAAQ